jgi:arylformamidase|tara:strand:- start:2288 stop:3031 length:744 start_codon:yes stop_codon:yes gene_type:complete
VILTFDNQGNSFQADLSKPLEIGISVRREHSVSSFGIIGAIYKDYQDGDFIGNKASGGPCNLETITFTPHGNSTHTECLGHISDEDYFVNDFIRDHFTIALLCTLSPRMEDDRFLDFSSIDLANVRKLDALVIRTSPNPITKLNKDYSGKKTPCIAPEDMKMIVAAGVSHLIVDLPSVDPEWDGGAMASHYAYWQYPEDPRMDASITEFVFVRDDIQDGKYLLKLNISNFESDAAPSRPVLYPIIAG